MTVGQQLIEQGRVEGRTEGIVSVLARGFARLGVHLTNAQIERLRGESPELLEALAADLFGAGSADAALAMLTQHFDRQV